MHFELTSIHVSSIVAAKLTNNRIPILIRKNP